jgi:hypothetical protein
LPCFQFARVLRSRPSGVAASQGTSFAKTPRPNGPRTTPAARNPNTGLNFSRPNSGTITPAWPGTAAVPCSFRVPESSSPLSVPKGKAPPRRAGQSIVADFGCHEFYQPSLLRGDVPQRVSSLCCQRLLISRRKAPRPNAGALKSASRPATRAPIPPGHAWRRRERDARRARGERRRGTAASSLGMGSGYRRCCIGAPRCAPGPVLRRAADCRRHLVMNSFRPTLTIAVALVGAAITIGLTMWESQKGKTRGPVIIDDQFVSHRQRLK